VDLIYPMLESDLRDTDAKQLFTGHPLGQGADLVRAETTSMQVKRHVDTRG
jgi:hypothetical protein